MLVIRKSLFDKICKDYDIEKAYKYIRRYMGKDGKWLYVYPSNQPRNVTKRAAIKKIAMETPIIQGAILDDLSEENIDKELDKLNKLGDSLRCKALGNKQIYINETTKSHGFETKGKDRSDEETIHKMRYLPFVPEILKNGKLLFKSYRHEYEFDEETGKYGKQLKHKHMTYGIVCRIKYFDKSKGKNVVEPLEIAVAYDEEHKNYVLSFIDYDIKVEKK